MIEVVLREILYVPIMPICPYQKNVKFIPSEIKQLYSNYHTGAIVQL